VAFAITVGNDRPADGPSLGAVYDPARDRWRPISNPGFGDPGQAFWIGDKVLVTGFSASGGTVPDVVGVATYDPRTDRWHRLPDAPVNLSTVVWTGHELIFAGGAVEPQDSNPPTRGGMTTVALDPATEQWRTLPAPPLARREDAIVAWTGDELVMAGGGSPADASAPGGRPLVSGASFDPVTETWTELPPAPVSFSGSVGTDAAILDGRLVAFHTLDPDHRSLTLDLATRTWRYGPPEPGGQRRFSTTVTAGHELLVWGGTIGRSETAVATGFSYSPPG
jgi:N-acetylneuraminic acid mutarotase